MGARFDRWLARPSTIHFLRQLVGPQAGSYHDNHVGSVTRRWNATAAVATVGADGEEHDRTAERKRRRPKPASYAPAQRQTPGFRKVGDNGHEGSDPDIRPSPAELLGASTHDYGLRMSMSSGVPLLDQELDSLNTFSELRRQADVNDEQNLGKLIVDQPQHKMNMDLWIELLHFRQRLNGAQGVLDIWSGMRKRDVALPVDGDAADVLWSSVVRAIFDHDITMRDYWLSALVTHAVDVQSWTGRHYPKLYKCIVGAYWRSSAAEPARFWHEKLSHAGFAPSDALKQVAPDVVRSRMPFAELRYFQRMYKRGAERDLYDVLISTCLDLSLTQSALRWHRWLLEYGDLPSKDIAHTQRIRELFSQREPRRLTDVGSREAMAIKGRGSEHFTLTRHGMSSMIGEVHGIKQKEFSDTFVAKMFATQAFSLNIVIRGLHFFAVDRVGPVALRELAVRARTPAEFCNKMHDLRAMGVLVVDAAYSRLVQKLANEGQSNLFNVLLASDQHPEAYDDTATQEALLVSFLESRDWAQAHITLLGLTLAGGQRHDRASNRILQHHLRNKQWQAIPQIMHMMQAQKVSLTPTTISCLMQYLLPKRRVRRRPAESQRPDRPHFNPLQFVVNACMYGEDQQRGLVQAPTWIELMKRHGMSFRWNELERLVLWVAERYKMERVHFRRRAVREREQDMHQGIRRTTRRKRLAAMQQASTLYAIFNEARQQAIFGWCLRSVGVRQQLRRRWNSTVRDQLIQPDEASPTTAADVPPDAEPWARGLVLLKSLQRDYGVPIDKSGLRKHIVMRLWVLFGPAYSNLRINEVVRRGNEIPLGHYIRHINELWPTPQPLFGDIDSNVIAAAAGGDDPQSEAQLVIALFGKTSGGLRRTGEYKHVQEYVDVVRWANAIAASPKGLGTGRHRMPLTSYQRQQIWQRSSFRVERPKAASSPYAPGGGKWRHDLETTKWGGKTTSSAR